MEVYLRFGLLITAVIIIALIVVDGWYRKRQAKRFFSSMDDRVPPLHPDNVLGLGNEDEVSSPQLVPMFSPADSSLYADDKIEAASDSDVHFSIDTVTEPFLTDPFLTDPIETSKNKIDLIVVSVMAKPGQLFGSYDLLQTLLSAGMQFGEMNIFHFYQPAALGRAKLFSLVSATEPGDFDLDKIGQFTCKGLTLFMHVNEVPNALEAFDILLKTSQQLADELDGELYTETREPLTTEMIHEYRQMLWKQQGVLSV